MRLSELVQHLNNVIIKYGDVNLDGRKIEISDESFMIRPFNIFDLFIFKIKGLIYRRKNKNKERYFIG